MIILDWILVVLLFLGAIKGWRQGFLRQLASLIGLIAGIFLAKALYVALGGMIAPHLNNHTTAANTIAFVLIWIAVPVVLGLLAELFSKILDKLFVLGKANGLLGALFGLLKYGVILGALIWVFSSTGIIGQATMDESYLCKPLKVLPEHVYSALINQNAGKE